MTPERPTKRRIGETPRGRPRKSDPPRPRPHQITIRLNDPEFAALVARAERTSRSVTGEATTIVTRIVSGRGVS